MLPIHESEIETVTYLPGALARSWETEMNIFWTDSSTCLLAALYSFVGGFVNGDQQVHRVPK